MVKQRIALITLLIILTSILYGTYSIFKDEKSNENITGEEIIKYLNSQNKLQINEVDIYLENQSYKTVLRGQTTYLGSRNKYMMKNSYNGVTTNLYVDNEKVSAPDDAYPFINLDISSKEGKKRIETDYMSGASPLKSLKGKVFKKISEDTYLYEGKCFNQPATCLREKTTITFDKKNRPLRIDRNMTVENKGVNHFLTDFAYDIDLAMYKLPSFESSN